MLGDGVVGDRVVGAEFPRAGVCGSRCGRCLVYREIARVGSWCGIEISKWEPSLLQKAFDGAGVVGVVI